MQGARSLCVNKSAAFSSVAKNTSCSQGWLRFVMQSIFALVTIATFILIVLMAVMTTPKLAKPVGPKCKVVGCIVICNEAPYYGLYEDEIVCAVALAETKCKKVSLELNRPFFKNNTLKTNWLTKLQSNINQLSIIDGNLNHLLSTSFMSLFTESIQILLLQDLHLKTWETGSLVGLSSLKTLTIINCVIDEFQVDSIRAVDDTLETLSITESGYWDPVNVTGSKALQRLTVVNFSNNKFNSILGKDSFVGLDKCKILYLNSCEIVSIKAGAFDSLKSIEVLYLDFNLLVTVPPGLFYSITQLDNPRPRVSLQENFWQCNCETDDLRQLVRKEILLVEGICTYPSSMEGKTFTEFDDSCVNETKDRKIIKTLNKTHITGSFTGLNDDKIYIKGTCRSKSKKISALTKAIFNGISPQLNSKCSINRTKHVDVSSILNINLILATNEYWLKFNFYLKSGKFNALQVTIKKQIADYGILWFQSDCPEELYCIDYMPSFLQIYNVNEKSRFTFCPMQLSTGDIKNDACVGYAIDDFENEPEESGISFVTWLTVSLIAVIFLCFGAIIVYGLIRMNPSLLKGSKRILFVKHKTVDALVLPPKVPLRNDLINDITPDFKDKEIFTLCTNDKVKFPKMDRMKSMRSNKSSSPSYISALQPSDEQLAEWRITRHFNNDLTISSRSELSTLSWICTDTSYHSIESDRTYESLK